MIIYLGFRPGLWYMRGKLRDSWVGKEGNQDLGFRSSLLAWQVKDQACHCCGLGHSSYVGLIPSLVTSARHWHSQKKKVLNFGQGKLAKLERYASGGDV